jgi:hypothetical protein
MGDNTIRDMLLKTTLQAAVPLWQIKLRERPWADIEAMLAEAQRILSDKSEILLFGGGKKGEVAEAFNALARAIAILSFMPGGVDAFGEHWEAQHPGLVPGSAPRKEP